MVLANRFPRFTIPCSPLSGGAAAGDYRTAAFAGGITSIPFFDVLRSRQVKRGYSLKQAVALIFDMDGVMVHSTPLHSLSWQVYLERHGIRRDRESIEAVMLGKHNTEIVRIFFGDGLTEAEMLLHGAEKEKLFRELMRPRLMESLVPGIVSFLERFRGAPMAVASNAEAPNVAFVLEEAGLRSHFQAVVDSHQVERPKPHPEIYLRAAKMLGVAADGCIVFEDSETGVQSGRAAGARVVGVTTTTPELAGTDLNIRDFLDPKLDSWLEQFQPIV